MKDIKSVVAENLVNLRKKKGITQAQLAEKFNYSDKAICRWEGGETLPDINVLYALAEFYGITMNDLVDDNFSADAVKEKNRNATGYKVWKCLFVSSLVWLVAALVFAVSSAHYWLSFIIAIPVTALVILCMLRRKLGVSGNIIVSSVFSWTAITTVYLHLLILFEMNIWHVFIVGVPLQAVIIHLFCMRRYKKVAKKSVAADVSVS